MLFTKLIYVISYIMFHSTGKCISKDNVTDTCTTKDNSMDNSMDTCTEDTRYHHASSPTDESRGQPCYHMAL